MKNKFIKLINDRVYLVIMFLTLISSYGYAITHSGIGMDDTAVDLYFHDGLAPYVGRWTLFVLGKVIQLDRYAPFFY